MPQDPRVNTEETLKYNKYSSAAHTSAAHTLKFYIFLNPYTQHREQAMNITRGQWASLSPYPAITLPKASR